MAASAFSRARLLNELSRPRSSSPRDEEFATATGLSFDPARDAIHSTARFDEFTNTQQQLPQTRQPFSHVQNLDGARGEDSEGSASMMSIELGRGVKRGARDQDGDVSSNVVFNMGNDSLYEVTATPPIRNRTPQRKSMDGSLRKQASTRRASEAVNGRETGDKHRSLSSALNAANNKPSMSLPKQRQTSVPSRFASNNARTVDGVNNAPTVSNQSFLLPEGLPDLTELVSGTRKDGTPVFNRNTKSRSRFTSGSYKPARGDHHPIGGVPLPEEEKAIYTSLQLLKERVEQLEMDKAEAQKRAEEYEDQIVELQSQLTVAQRRPDSALGSDEDSAGNEKLRRDKTRLQASAKSLQTHLDRSERKLSVAEIAVKRMREERDKLVEQIGKAYFDFEEVKAENDLYKEGIGDMQEENEGLKQEVQALKEQLQALNASNAQSRTRDPDAKQDRERRSTRPRSGAEQVSQGDLRRMSRSRKDANPALDEDTEDGRPSTGQLRDDLADDIASRVLREVQKNRERASKANGLSRVGASVAGPQKTPNSVFKPQQRSHDAPPQNSTSQGRRAVSAPTESEHSDAESTTQLDFTRNAKDTTATSKSGRAAHTASAMPRDEDRDYTVLSLLDPIEVGKLRKKIEEDHRAGRLSSAPSAPQSAPAVNRAAPNLGRKSSLKDVTGNPGEHSGQFSLQGGTLDPSIKVSKNVRVQSPQSAGDIEHSNNKENADGDSGFLSNTSRRRRRAVSADGDPSVFILPDITFNNNNVRQADFEKASIPHDAKTCSACPPNGHSITATPANPIPVTTREEYDPDVTNATVRPSEPPATALANVLKQLEDEIKHLKQKLAVFNALYTRHDPAMHKSRRLDVAKTIASLTAEIEKRSNQVYALYDVLEGAEFNKKDGSNNPASHGDDIEDDDKVNGTLQSIGMDPAEISGRVGRGTSGPFAPAAARATVGGLDGILDQISEQSDELPWEGLSDFDGSNPDD